MSMKEDYLLIRFNCPTIVADRSMTEQLDFYALIFAERSQSVYAKLILITILWPANYF